MFRALWGWRFFGTAMFTAFMRRWRAVAFAIPGRRRPMVVRLFARRGWGRAVMRTRRQGAWAALIARRRTARMFAGRRRRSVVGCFRSIAGSCDKQGRSEKK